MVDDLRSRQSVFVEELKNAGASLVGFGDLSAQRKKHSVAVSLAVKLDESVVDNLHCDEKSFHNHLVGQSVPLERSIKRAHDLLTSWGYESAAMPISILIQSDTQLRGLDTFSHKMAATSAGLGWIGKCSLLITPEYGPRVKLGTVLTNAPFSTAEPVLSSNCGACTRCSEACPYAAIHRTNWERGMKRDELFDAFLCNRKRLEFREVIGRKHSCGLCMQACPVGRNA